MGLRATGRESHDGEELPDATFWPEVALTALQPSTLLFAKAISTSYGILDELRQGRSAAKDTKLFVLLRS